MGKSPIGGLSIAVVAATLFAGGAALANPLEALLSSGGDGVCFDRVYDAAHLQRVPGQETRTVRASLVRDDTIRDGATARIVLEGEVRLSIVVATCQWKAQANRNSQGRPLVDTFKGKGGLDCTALAAIEPAGDQDGGGFVIDLRDGKSMLLHLPDHLAVWPTFQRRNEAGWEEFGTDDRVFRLDRVERGLCHGMEEALPVMR